MGAERKSMKKGGVVGMERWSVQGSEGKRQE